MITGKSIFNISHKEPLFVITFDLMLSKISNIQILTYMRFKQRIAILFLLIPLLSFNQKNRKVGIKDTLRYSLSMSYEAIVDMFYLYESFLDISLLGYSEFGQAIPLLKISEKSDVKKKPVLIVGNLHAREFYSSKFVLKFCDEFLYSLLSYDGIYKSAHKILEEYDLFVIPVANPDGLKIAQEDWEGIESYRAMVDSIKRIGPYSDWKANGKGIDLNNNFDDGNFEVKHGHLFEEVPASQGYKGAFPCEANEARIIQDFVDTLIPLITLSYHTKGDVLFWADRGTHSYFKGLDELLNKKVANACEFKMARVSRNPKDYGAGLENYIRAKTKRIAVCVELSPPNDLVEQHPANMFKSLVWDKCKSMPIIYLEELSRLYPRYKYLFEP